MGERRDTIFEPGDYVSGSFDFGRSGKQMRGRDCLEKLRYGGPVVLPSLLLCDFGNLEREVRRLEEAGFVGLHLDVMDGVFVPNFTYGMTIVDALRKLTELPLDVHLMMTSPEKFVNQFSDAGADLITVHFEALEEPEAVLSQIKSNGCGVGIAVNPDTPVDELDRCLPICDMAVIMSVQAGFGGQKFDDRGLHKLLRARELGGDDLLLEIDGGVNSETIHRCVEHGAQLLVAGSAIFREPDYAIAHERLRSHMTTD